MNAALLTRIPRAWIVLHSMNAPRPRPALRLLLLLALLLGTAACARAEESTLFERYFIIYENGSPVGRYYEKMVRKAEGGRPAQILTSRESKRAMVRGADMAINEEDELYVEDEQGHPVRYESRSKSSKDERTVRATFADNKVHLKISGSGSNQDLTEDLDGPCLFPYAERRLRKEKGFAPGTTYSYALFISDLGKARTVTATVKPPRAAGDKGGVALPAVEMTGLMPGVTMTVFCDPDGNARTVEVDVNDLRIDACEKDDWEKPIERPRVDVMKANFVDPGLLLPAPARLKQALYRVTLTKGDLGALALEDERQTIVKREGEQTLLLQVDRKDFDASQAPSLPLPEADRTRLAAFLAPSPTIQSDDDEIVKTAAKALDGERNAWRAAKALELFVFRSIKKKGYGTAFATAKEVQRNREGDCTEHAVWLAALLRAAGIPSKIATGVTLGEGYFVHHMWTEAWVGQWVALDATLGEPSVDPAHIELADSPLEGIGPGEKILATMQAFGRLRIEVEKVVLKDGTLLDAAALKAPPKVENGRFLDAAMGVSFPVPDGFTAYPRGSAWPQGFKASRVHLALLRDEKRNINIEVVNVNVPYAIALGYIEKEVRAEAQKVPNGHVMLGAPVLNRRLAAAIAPGSLFRFELRCANTADTSALAKVIEGLRLDSVAP